MSVVSLYGANNGKCGYCKKNQWHTYGLGCTSMIPQDYEALMIRGWRRCGDYYYKPNVDKCCCKLNTIRCDASRFTANPEQQKVMRKLQKFLEGKNISQRNKKEERKTKKLAIKIPEELVATLNHSISSICQENGIEFKESYVKIAKNPDSKKSTHGDYSITSVLVLRKLLPEEKLVESIVSQISQKFQIHSVSNGFINILYEVPEENPVEDIPMNNEPHSYRSEVVPDAFSEDSFELYKKYQIAVHKDKPSSITKNGYTRFLCESSLQRLPPSQEHPLGLGSFHMRHYLDNQLVAVGVLDILPSGVSSVYFLYDPSIKFLSPGKFGAIKEIELIQQHLSDKFKYYYMGYYIDSCHKMKYKGDYMPSELVCPKKYLWVPIEDCIATKDRHGFMELSPYSRTTSELPMNKDMDFGTDDLFQFCFNNIKLKVNNRILGLSQINPSAINYLMGILMEVISLIGKHLTKSLIFAFN